MQAALDQDFLFLLYDVARTMRTRADQRARARGMTRAQWVILAHLERQPGLTQNELAAIVEVEPITIARLVDRLEARELLERKADPRDRRVWRLHLTPAAAPILREIAKYRAELHEVITAGMSPALQKALTDGLLQMKANLAADARVMGKAGSAATATPSHNGGALRRVRHA
jgi:MarR family transcriptional regulator, transcriptional regulator for hemolysin